ncbi:MAG: MraY family glycosyltransferase [bacterium]
MIYLLSFIASFLLSLILTFAIIKLAKRWHIMDKPDKERKIHVKPTPLLGGVAIFLAMAVVMFFVKDRLIAGELEYHHWIGVLIGALFLIIGGILDDKYDLSPKYQIIWPVLAVVSVILGGVGIEKITNPFGDFLYLDQIKFPLLAWAGQMHYFVLIADCFTILWLMGMIYTTKLLDGLDGLVGGVAAIGSLIIFLFTITTKYYQPDIALAALILVGACFGFLILNWHPAKIFLGSTGSMFLGFILGVLSIISGGKIAIALLIMGIPILDVVWTILRRLRAGKNPFKHADRKHLHFRMLDTGLGTRKTVLIYYMLAVVFGLSALFLQSRGKLVSLVALSAIMIGIIIIFAYLDKKSKTV